MGRAFVAANPVQHQQGDLPATRRHGKQTRVCHSTDEIPGRQVRPVASAAPSRWR